MKLGYLLSRCDCSAYKSNVEIKDVCCDSRRVSPHSAFVCIHGGDEGLGYMKEAQSRGAVALICEEELAERFDGAVACKNPRRVLSYMFDTFCGKPSEKMKLIAVTGTNGKTGTAFMLYTMLVRMGKKAAVIGTTGCFCMGAECMPCDTFAADRFRTMTTPDPEFLYPALRYMAQSKIEYVIIEASSHAIKQQKLAPLNFEYGIFTNMSSEHMDFHKNMLDYYETKLSLFEKCKNGIFNADDEYSNAAYASCKCVKKRLCSLKSSADYKASEICTCGENGVTYHLEHAASSTPVSALMPGVIGVYNSMLACACLSEALGCFDELSKYALNLPSPEGRMQKISASNSDISVFIDYAHTPTALQTVLNDVRAFKTDGQRIVLLFGCGGDRDREKRSLMGDIASRLADFTYITEDNSRSEGVAAIIKDIMRGFDKSKPHKIIRDRKDAIERAISEALPGDIVILAGKGHEKYELSKDGRKNFDETAIASAALKKRMEQNG